MTARLHVDPLTRLYAYARGLDATRIAPRLYQGGAPPPGDVLRRHGFDVLVLCADEYQPHASDYPGVVVRRYPMVDDVITQRTWTMADRAADEIIRDLRMGKRVFVSCVLGKNRSGLVVTKVLCKARGMSGTEAVRRVRKKRSEALDNESFVDVMRRAWP